MAISSLSFNNIGRRCLVTIVQDAARETIVDIYGFRKVIREQVAVIDITSYLRATMGNIGSLEEGNIADSNAGIQPMVEIDGKQYYGDRVYSIGDSTYEQRVLSDCNVRIERDAHTVGDYIFHDTIVRQTTKGGTDYVAISNVPKRYTVESMIDGGIEYEWENSDDYETNVIVPIQDIDPNMDYDIRVFPDGTGDIHVYPIKYITKPRGLHARQFAWVNRYGVLDNWVFDFCREESLVTASDAIYTADGYQRVNRQTEKQYIYETRELTHSLADAIAYIISSPKVFDVDDFSEWDVITESCRVFSDEEHTTIQIAVRPKKRIV